MNSFIVSIDAKWSGLHRQSALCALLYKKSALKLFRAYLKFDYCIILSSNGIFCIHFAALSTQKQGKLLISLSFAVEKKEMQRKKRERERGGQGRLVADELGKVRVVGDTVL